MLYVICKPTFELKSFCQCSYLILMKNSIILFFFQMYIFFNVIACLSLTTNYLLVSVYKKILCK